MKRATRTDASDIAIDNLIYTFTMNDPDTTAARTSWSPQLDRPYTEGRPEFSYKAWFIDEGDEAAAWAESLDASPIEAAFYVRTTALRPRRDPGTTVSFASDTDSHCRCGRVKPAGSIGDLAGKS